LALVIVHILVLHDNGSNGPKGSGNEEDLASFGGFFILKDIYLLSQGLFVFSAFLVFAPNVLNHPDNYNQANPMQTPAHIVPEWYFLPFYAILRAIPSKS
jgi:ubiquinol-cytochrome c reductase cytochrome b subunit